VTYVAPGTEHTSREGLWQQSCRDRVVVDLYNGALLLQEEAPLQFTVQSLRESLSDC
jgi:hypothetical protein